MFIVRIAFPSAHRADKVSIFEWLFKGATSELTWEMLINKLCDHTRTKRGKFYVSWHDGTEYCTISTNESLREAVNNMLVNRSDGTPLIYVAPVVAPDEKKLGGFFGGCAPEDLPRDFREQVDTPGREEESDHNQSNGNGMTQLICNQCKREDWRGDKFSCVVCPKVVLCGPCYKSGFHAQHPILITRDCSGYPSTILQAVRVVASNIVAHHESDDDDDDDESPGLNNKEIAKEIDSRGSSNYYSDVFKPITNPEPEDPKVVAAIQQLRAMGFSQDYNRLSQLAKEENGDVCSMIEKLVN